VISAQSEMAYIEATNSVKGIITGEYPALSNLILLDGCSHRIKIYGMELDGTQYSYNPVGQFDVTVKGVYGTIFPFEES